MSADWTQWENRLIGGVYPLRRFLGQSDHSVVFLTEHRAKGLAQAAIKLIPADPALTAVQLSYWRSAATLSHPHLLPILDAGSCALGGHPFLFVVLEYAKETLAQILPQRALTTDEVRGLLRPMLETLAYLHGKGWAHGQLKPPNVLVVGDQVKLAGDNLLPIGKSRPGFTKPSPYDPPESKGGAVSAAGDVWGLGVILVEALTQRLPELKGDSAVEPAASVSLPDSVPPAFVDLLRRCLSRDPTRRPPIAELNDRFYAVPPPASEAPPAVDHGPVISIPLWNAFNHGWILSATAAALLLIITASVGLSLRHAQPPSSAGVSPDSTAISAPSAAAPNQNAPMVRPAPSSQPPADAAQAVLHEEIPKVPRSARESIHGDIKVAIYVSVDRSGKVVGQKIELHGGSKYFARLASEAAKTWSFVAADHPNSREWLLRFEFTRAGATAHATARP